jgi:hypothetical protein
MFGRNKKNPPFGGLPSHTTRIECSRAEPLGLTPVRVLLLLSWTLIAATLLAWLLARRLRLLPGLLARRLAGLALTGLARIGH